MKTQLSHQSEDVIGFGVRGLEVSLSSGMRLNASLLWLSDLGELQGWNNSQHLRRTVNLNNDGKADILGIYNDKIVTHTSQGNGFSAAQVIRDAIVLNFNPDKERRLIGDVTGDGREDIVIVKANGVYVLVANDNGGYEK